MDLWPLNAAPTDDVAAVSGIGGGQVSDRASGLTSCPEPGGSRLGDRKRVPR